MKTVFSNFKKKTALVFVLTTVLLFSACNEKVTPEWTIENSTELSLDFARNVQIDNNGDIIVVADSFDKSEEVRVDRFLVLKYNAAGDLLWSFPYVGRSDRSYGYHIDSDNNIYIAGTSEEGSYVIKLYADGTEAWINSDLTGDWLSGGLVVSGDQVYVSNYNTYALSSSTGEVIWEVESDMRTTDVGLDDSGNLFVTGYDHLTCLTPEGTQLWSKEWSTDYGSVNLVFNSDSQLFAVAKNISGDDVNVMKINTKTGEITNTISETAGSGWAPKIAFDGSGNLILAVSVARTTNGRKVFKYNTSMTRLWAESFESGKDDLDLDQLVVASNGEIYITGGNKTTKIDSSGNKIVTIETGTIYSNNFMTLDATEENLYIVSAKEYYDNKNITLTKYYVGQ